MSFFQLHPPQCEVIASHSLPDELCDELCGFDWNRSERGLAKASEIKIQFWSYRHIFWCTVGQWLEWEFWGGFCLKYIYIPPLSILCVHYPLSFVSTEKRRSEPNRFVCWIFGLFFGIHKRVGDGAVRLDWKVDCGYYAKPMLFLDRGSIWFFCVGTSFLLVWV